jgi:hypothetical protein
MIILKPSLSYRIRAKLTNWFHKLWNPYNLDLPGGECPVQAEGYLPTGEYYYFRSRWDTWRVLIGREEEYIFDEYLFECSQENFIDCPAAGWISRFHAYILLNRAVKEYYDHKTYLQAFLLQHTEIGENNNYEITY